MRVKPCRLGWTVLAPLLALAACQSSLEQADAYEAQYDHLMALKAYPAALMSINKSIAQDDTNARRYFKRAEVQLQLGAPADAASSFQAGLDLQPDNIEALQNLAILSVRAGQFDRARQYIEPLLALSPNDPAGVLASGAVALGERRFKDALKFSDQLIGIMSDRPDGYVLKARALDGLGQTRDAIDLLEKRAAVASDPKELLLQLMAIYRRIGNTTGIRATAIRLMPLIPDDPRYALESARAYAAQGRQDKVRTIVDGLLRRFPNDSGVLVAVGDFWRDTQPLSVARAEMAKIAAAAPAATRPALADQLLAMGDPQAALRLLAPLAPATVTSANIDNQGRYARALLAAGQYDAAKAKVDSILAFDGGNPRGLLLRAQLRLRARDYRGAFTDAQLVAKDDNQNEEAALLVARIYAEQGNQLLAGGAYGTARQQFPNSVAALNAEVDWLLSQNRGAEAAQRAASFYHAHPRSGPAAEIYHNVCRRTGVAACGNGPSNVARMLAT